MSNDDNRLYQKLDTIDEKFDKKFKRLDRCVDYQAQELAVYNKQLKLYIDDIKEARQDHKAFREYIDQITNIETKPEKNKKPSVIRNITWLAIETSVFMTILTGTLYWLGYSFGWF
jgi:hypothetical protein